jgi:hypothetical protein
MKADSMNVKFETSTFSKCNSKSILKVTYVISDQYSKNLNLFQGLISGWILWTLDIVNSLMFNEKIYVSH